MAVARAAAVALGLAALLLLPVGASALSISGTVASGGALSLTLSGTDPNGSSLRSAMDGNFAPLVDSLPINATERSTILAAIALQESGLAGALLFGNRDGTVEANEVTMFETVIQDAGSTLSSFGVSSTNLSVAAVVALTFDGAPPTSTTLGSVSFSNAVGPTTSSAPIGVSLGLTLQFPSSGTSHTLVLGTNSSTLGLSLSLVAPDILVNLTFPAGTTVTGTTGFTALSTGSDPWGWSSPSISGTYAPGASSTVSVSYGPAFPTGDTVAVGVPIAVAAGVLGFLLWRRRRRRARPAPAAAAP